MTVETVGMPAGNHVRLPAKLRILTFGLVLVSGLAVAVPSETPEGESRCFGSVARGRIEGAVKLPSSGRNFQAYSDLAATLGRTYVHSRVRKVVVDAYAALAGAAPDKVFVYGETGLAEGGRFRPHRTHQNGLSADFMVPVVDPAGRSVPLPTNAADRFGYDLRFDKAGRHDDYRIDFEAMAEHLYQLHAAATARGVGIALVIFEPEYHQRLFATRRGAFLRTLPWMKRSAWIRHDNHYHVDFALPCAPLGPTASQRK